MASSDPGQRLGRYHLIEPLGGGPMGEVYRAKVVGVAGLDRHFAVKRIHASVLAEPGLAPKLSQASRTYAGLDHPRIAKMSELGVGGGETFTVTDLVAGLDLARLQGTVAQAGTSLPAGAALGLISAAARAVGYAHGRGVCHWGLCPTNLLATADGDVRVTDFGIFACRLGARPAADPSLLGRLAYVAPEQLVGDPVSAATDVFSLGVLAYELISGTRPFVGGTGVELEQAILSARPIALELPRPVARVIDRCLARSPFERFPDARALADALDAALRLSPMVGDRRDVGDRVRTALDHLASVRENQLSGAFTLALPTAPVASGSTPRPRAERAAGVPLPLPPIPSPGSVRVPRLPTVEPTGPIPRSEQTAPIARIEQTTPVPRIEQTTPVPRIATVEASGPTPRPATVEASGPASTGTSSPARPPTRPGTVTPGMTTLTGVAPIPRTPGPSSEFTDDETWVPPALGISSAPEVPADAPSPSPSPSLAPGSTESAAPPPVTAPRVTAVSAVAPVAPLKMVKIAAPAAPVIARVPSAPVEPFAASSAAPSESSGVDGPSLTLDADEPPAVTPPSDQPAPLLQPLWPPTEQVPTLRPPTARAEELELLSSLESSLVASETPEDPPMFAPSPPRPPTLPPPFGIAAGPAPELPAPPPMLVRVTVPGQPAVAPGGGGRRALWFGLGAVVLAGAVGGGVVLWQRHQRSSGDDVVAAGPGSGPAVVPSPAPLDARAVDAPRAIDAAADVPDATAMAAIAPDAAVALDAAAAPLDAAAAPLDAAVVIDAGKPIDAAPVDAAALVDAAVARPPADGFLIVDVSPRGARVFLDGVEVGKSPVKVPAVAGSREVAALLPGYQLHTATIDGAGRHQATLPAAPRWAGAGGIKVRCTTPRRFYVSVDGVGTGQFCPTERIGVRVGKHTVEIYDPIARTRKTFPADVVDTDHSLKVDVE